MKWLRQTGVLGMPPNPERPSTSVLLIDGNGPDRAFYAEELRSCSPDYNIVEATDGQSGLDRYRSQRIDCVVTELTLSDKAGFEILADFVPVASRPRVAVIVLASIGCPGVGDLATQNGAYACCVKAQTSGEDLDKAIQRAVEFVGQMSKGA
jgi:DNA-binding NarL/FixJ family response regulator